MREDLGGAGQGQVEEGGPPEEGGPLGEGGPRGEDGEEEAQLPGLHGGDQNEEEEEEEEEEEKYGGEMRMSTDRIVVSRVGDGGAGGAWLC